MAGQVNAERHVAEEVAAGRVRAVVVGHMRRQQWLSSGRLRRRQVDAGRQEGVPVERFVRIQFAAPDERGGQEVERRQELVAHRRRRRTVIVVVRRRGHRQDNDADGRPGRGVPLRFELQL